MEKINTVKGTKDLFGKDLIKHNFIYDTFSNVCESKNFQPISTPIIESSVLKTLGILQILFLKKCIILLTGGEEIVLRPEGTAAVARALVTNSMQDDLNKNFTIMDLCLEGKAALEDLDNFTKWS